jgi:hypothetical protein
MNKTIKLIRDTLNEIFDSYSLPNGLKEDNGSFTFIYNNIEYYVDLTPFVTTSDYMIEDVGILNIINSAPKKYIIDFGIIENNKKSYNVKTNSGKPIEIIKFVIGIILKLLEEHEVDVLSYVPNSKIRDRMFDEIVKNFALNKFVRYRKK